MKILVSNDDGYRAEGIRALAAALKDLGASDRGRAGSQSQRRQQFSDARCAAAGASSPQPDVFCVMGGTPTDCVHLAISGLFNFEHDMVVSGVNDGANLGDDVLYSGTVAAAMEGRFLGLPTTGGLAGYGSAAADISRPGPGSRALLVRRLLAQPARDARSFSM